MLFRPNKVITAAHCIGEEKSLRVGDLAHVGGLTFKQGLSSWVRLLRREEGGKEGRRGRGGKLGGWAEIAKVVGQAERRPLRAPYAGHCPGC